MDAPNIVLIVLDTARSDAVAASPSFGALASSGWTPERAVAPAPWTLPSHASLFSGLMPSEHGVTGASVMGESGGIRSPRSIIEALGERWLPVGMRARGYATFAATANPWVGEAMGLTHGFDRIVETWRSASLPKLSDPWRHGAGGSSKARGAEVYARRLFGLGDGGAHAAFDAFDSFTADTPEPFFAFFNLMEPHAPYAPPRAHVGFGERLAALRTVRRWDADRMLAYSLGQEEIGDAELGLLRELYRAEVAYSDAWVGRVLNLLADRGRLDDTVVVVTSDHGESFGEDHRLSHVLSMRDALIAVPLAIAGPAVPHAEGPGPVSLCQIPAALHALAGGTWRELSGGGAAVSQYESAAAQVSGGRPIHERVAGMSEDVRADVDARQTAVYEGSLKYLGRSDGREELFDLSRDPGEEFDLASSRPDDVRRLRDHRGAWSGATQVANDDERQAPDALEDAEITRHLEGLGYL